MWSYMRLALWAMFWFLGWVISYPFKKGRHNCLTWAVQQWEEREGGYLVIRWSRSSKHHWFKWPHFLYLPEGKDENLEQFLPDRDEDLVHSIPKAWFHGHIKKGDEFEPGEKEN